MSRGAAPRPQPRPHGRLRRGLGLAARGLGWSALALLAALAALVGWQQVADRRPAPERAQLSAEGRAAYARWCAPCHGEHMQGRALGGALEAPPLAKPGFRIFFRLLPSAMEGWVREQIAEGTPPMPPFGRQLDARTLDGLALFVHRVNVGREPPP
jgi:mono/diheme cytochrome c family protein